MSASFNAGMKITMQRGLLIKRCRSYSRIRQFCCPTNSRDNRQRNNATGDEGMNSSERTMVTTLENCPFCGNAPTIRTSTNHIWIQCEHPSCNAIVQSCLEDTEEAAIATWNHRAIAQHNDEIDALSRTVESIHGDAEGFIKLSHDERLSKKAMLRVLHAIHQKCESVRHITKKKDK